MIPCDAVEYSSQEMLEIGLMENIQREELQPLDAAHAFQSLIAEGGYSIRSLAERIGKDKGYVEERLALLHTPSDVQQMLEQRPDAPLRAAREIAKLPEPRDRKPLIDGVLAGTLTRDDVVAQVREASTPGGRTAARERTVERVMPGAQRPIDQAIDRDVMMLRVILARWRQAALHFDDAQKERMLGHIDTHVRDLEALAEVLQR